MNREILFRAKSIQTGRWISGYYFEDEDSKSYIGYMSKKRYVPDTRDWDIAEYYENNPTYNWVFVKEEVVSETVGQYTGLTDKNGTKIFEGDIITFEDVCCEGGSGYEYPDEWAVEAMNRVEVIIRNGCVCFGKELFESNAYEDIQFYYPNLNEWFTECAEVIGNIYDNSELLKA